MKPIDADLIGLTDMEILLCNGDYKEALKMLIDKINNAPPVVPEPRKGKWIKTGQSFVFPEKFMNYSCSECGYDVDKIKFNFCPNCGADMRGKNNDIM